MSIKAYCPNPKCDGVDSVYLNDDLVHHECDKCGTTWGTYDPQERPEQAINVKIKSDCFVRASPKTQREKLETESLTSLRSCPFCGSKAMTIKSNGYEDEEWYVQCIGCTCSKGKSCCGYIDSAEYGEYHSEEDAVEAWNKRV